MDLQPFISLEVEEEVSWPLRNSSSDFIRELILMAFPPRVDVLFNLRLSTQHFLEIL